MLIAESGMDQAFTSVLSFMANMTALVGAATLFIVAIKRMKREFRRRDDVTDERVNLLWTAHMRRAGVESRKGASPVVKESRQAMTGVEIRPDVREAFAPLAPALRRLYLEMDNPTPGAVGERIEARYGAWIAKHICAVHGMTEFECLEIARIVAMEPGDTSAVGSQSIYETPKHGQLDRLMGDKGEHEEKT